MFKLVLVLLALIAVSQAYLIIESFSDSVCNETALVARFITTDPYLCNSAKRNSFALSGCDNTTLPGVTFGIDYSACDSAANLTFPVGWESVQFVNDANCNFTVGSPNYAYAIGAPQPLRNTLVAVWTSVTQKLDASNTTLTCGTDGTTSFTSCMDVWSIQQVCGVFSLPNNACIADDATSPNVYAQQTTCVAPPVTPPMSEPMTNGPTSGPVAGPTAPTQAPIKAPTSKTNAASIIYGSVAFLSLIALV